MLKASIQGDFDNADLYVEIVSADNEKQSGKYFEAFIEMINSKKDKIKKLAIIDTSFLHRHYDNKFSNETMETDWFKNNKGFLEKLQIDYEYISYKTIFKSKFYEPHYNSIKKDYTGSENGEDVDLAYRKSVKILSEKFIEKGTLREIVKFILDETAGYLAIIEFISEKIIKETNVEDPKKLKVIFSYPGGFNDCITHAKNKYITSSLVQCEEKSYRFRGKELKTINTNLNVEEKPMDSAEKNSRNNGNYSPTFFSRSLAYHIDLMNIKPEHQTIFSMKFIKFCAELKEEVRDDKKCEINL
ncbi:MAG: hypothetical protein LEGION0398_MBIBDBAK_00200 [Legionellaceae bacterium]